MSASPIELPYPEPGGQGFTDGWAGSPASHERALEDARLGKAQQRRAETIRALAIHGAAGLTWKELGDTMGWHHGQASGVLSVLHKEERIACLLDKRNKCHVYVLPDCVQDRETRPHGSTAAHQREQELVDTHDADVAAARTAGHTEGYRIGLAKGHEEGQIAGHAEGMSEGWQEGYDAAIGVIAGIEAKAQQAYDRGRKAGQVQEAKRQLALTQEMRRGIVRAKGSRMIVHSSSCWVEYPTCTIDAIEKGYTRIIEDNA